jgi:hypothetical protein
MFGGLAFMINTHMACGCMGPDLMVRVGAEGHAAALARGPREMAFTGRPMGPLRSTVVGRVVPQQGFSSVRVRYRPKSSERRWHDRWRNLTVDARAEHVGRCPLTRRDSYRRCSAAPLNRAREQPRHLRRRLLRSTGAWSRHSADRCVSPDPSGRLPRPLRSGRRKRARFDHPPTSFEVVGQIDRTAPPPRGHCYLFPPLSRTVCWVKPSAHSNVPQANEKATVMALPPANLPLFGTTFALHW